MLLCCRKHFVELPLFHTCRSRSSGEGHPSYNDVAHVINTVVLFRSACLFLVLFCTNMLLLTWVERQHCSCPCGEQCLTNCPVQQPENWIFECVWGIPKSGVWQVCISVGVPVATEWLSAGSVVHTVTCSGSFLQTYFIPSDTESLFYCTTDSWQW